MRAYADSSFLLRVVTGEADSPQAIAEYRQALELNPKLAEGLRGCWLQVYWATLCAATPGLMSLGNPARSHSINFARP